MPSNSFHLDRAHARIMGVCAGIARSTGVDVTIVRIAAVLVTICGFGVVGIAAYLLAGWLAPR